MGEQLADVLRSLRDVDGVVGSFVLDAQGGIDGRDLPEYFDAGALSEVGPRVGRLYDAWKSVGGELETAALVFAEHKLHVRELNGGYLVVVSAAQVNAPALRMAMAMVSRRIAAAQEARAGAAPASLPAARPAQRPSQPGPEPDPHGKPRVYRGNIVK